MDYPTWLSNIVLTTKVGGKHRICVDFTNLNTAMLKDCFPLPNVGQFVNAIVGFEMMSFIDPYLGYHWI